MSLSGAVYPTEEAWEADFAACSQSADRLAEFKGRLDDGEQVRIEYEGIRVLALKPDHGSTLG